MINPLSIGSPAFTNYVDYWAFNDDEETYNYNVKNRYNDLKSNGWLDSKKSIEYKFNKWGFRSDNFDSTGGVLFLGCSHVVGVGLAVSDTFSYIVGKQVNLPIYNLGITGGSNCAAFRVADYWIPKLKPKFVFMLQTYDERLEIINGQKTIGLAANNGKEYQNCKYFIDFLYTEINTIMLKKKNLYAIEHISKCHNAKFLTLDACDEVFIDLWKQDLARDLVHMGKKGNKTLADMITSMIMSA